MRRIGRRPNEAERTARILELAKQGLMAWQIAERMGSCRQSISTFLSIKKKMSNRKEYEARRNPDARRGKTKGSYVVKHPTINAFLAMKRP